MTDQEIEALRAFAADYEDHDAIGCVTSHAIPRLLEERRRLIEALRGIAEECEAQEADFRFCDVPCHIKARDALAFASAPSGDGK